MRARLAALKGLTFALAGAAHAAEPSPPGLADKGWGQGWASGWRFETTLTGWATNLDGLVGVDKPPFFQVNVRYAAVMPRGDVLPTAAVLARKDAYILGANFGLSTGSKTLTMALFSFLPQPKVEVTKARYSVGEVFAGYRLAFGPPDLSLYATLGARANLVTATIALADAPIGYYRSKALDAAWIDPTLGLLAEYRIDPKWSLKASGDIGGFDVGSHLSAQGGVAVGYDWTASISTSLGYKVLYTDCDLDKGDGRAFRYATTVHGPFASLSYAF